MTGPSSGMPVARYVPGGVLVADIGTTVAVAAVMKFHYVLLMGTSRRLLLAQVTLRVAGVAWANLPARTLAVV